MLEAAASLFVKLGKCRRRFSGRAQRHAAWREGLTAGSTSPSWTPALPRVTCKVACAGLRGWTCQSQWRCCMWQPFPWATSSARAWASTKRPPAPCPLRQVRNLRIGLLSWSMYDGISCRSTVAGMPPVPLCNSAALDVAKGRSGRLALLPHTLLPNPEGV